MRSLLLLLSFLVHCAGQRTTREFHPIASLDESCDAKGFTARSVLEQYLYKEVANVDYQSIYTGMHVSAAMEIGYNGGKLACAPSYLPTDSHTSLPATISIEIAVHFTTSDGFFDLTLNGRLWGVNARGATGSIDAFAPVTANRGSYKASLDEFELAYELGPIPGKLSSATLGERSSSGSNGFDVISFCSPIDNDACQF